jgi:hypothetical protein
MRVMRWRRMLKIGQGDADTDERAASGHELKAPSLTPISVHSAAPVIAVS